MGAELSVDIGLRLSTRAVPLRLSSDAAVVGVVGPSGAGKSTLLRVIAGLERRGVGQVSAFGERWQTPSGFLPPWRRGVGWVPQDAALFPHLSVRQNLAYAAKQEITEIARWLGVEALLDRAPRYLSGGERSRVALGRALLSQPRLLLLDEPFAALERKLRDRLAAELAERCRALRMPVVLVTHDEADLSAFSAERWSFEDGALVRT